MTHKAHLYLRVSTKKQASEGDGLARQKQLAIDALDSKLKDKWKLGSTYEDKGRSAFSGTNLKFGLGELINDVESGKIKEGDCVFVESVDRISRQGIETGNDPIEKILNKGVWIYAQKQDLLVDPCLKVRNSNIATKLQLILALELANRESQQKSDKIAQTFELKRSRGEKITNNIPKWLTPCKSAESGYKFNEHKDTLLKMIELRKTKRWGSLKICDYLKNNQLPVPDGVKYWSKSLIEKWLFKMPQVAGEYHQTKRNDLGQKEVVAVHEDYYPPVISKGEWVLLQNSRKKADSRGGLQKMRNLFTPLVKCPYCSGVMGYTNPPRAKPKLRCKNATYHKTCHNKVAFDYENIEQQLLKTFAHLDWAEVQGEAHSKEQIQQVSVELNNERERLEAMNQALESASVEAIPVVVKSINKISENIKNLEAQLAEAGERSAKVGEVKRVPESMEEREVYNTQINRLVECIIPVKRELEDRTPEIFMVALRSNRILGVKNDKGLSIKHGVLNNLGKVETNFERLVKGADGFLDVWTKFVDDIATDKPYSLEPALYRSKGFKTVELADMILRANSL